MKIIPFDIEKAKAGAKVVTRDGREVEIVKYDMKGTHFPVLYVISNEDGSQEPCECSKSGMCQFDNTKSSTDLFFADEDESMNEFETRIYNLINFSDPYNDPSIKEVKEEAEILLDLARKEILKSLPKWRNIVNDRDFYLHESLEDYFIKDRLHPNGTIKERWVLKKTDLEKLPKEQGNE